MSLFTKQKPVAEESAVEKLPKISRETTKAWWDLYTSLLAYAAEDYEGLRRNSDPEYAARTARAARNLTDAALAEYEDRFAIETEKE